MTKPRTDGNNARRVALEQQDLDLKKARLLRTAYDDITDGDDDTTTAERAIVELFEIVVNEHAIHGKVADTNYLDAEMLVTRLNASQRSTT